MIYRMLALVFCLTFYNVAGSDEPFRGRKTNRNVAPDGNDVLDGRYDNKFKSINVVLHSDIQIQK